MKRLMVAGTALGALLALGTNPVLGFDNMVGFPQKLKAAKLQTDLVPAFACADGNGLGGSSDTDPGCRGSLVAGGGSVGNVTKSAKNGRNCTFQSGTVKMQTGKDTQVQLKGVTCGGTLTTPGPALDGVTLCGQTVGYSTLSNVLLDKNNAVTPIAPCGTADSGFIEGSSNYTTAIVASSVGPCKKGTCKGSLSSTAQQSQNPCPHSDTISELRRIEIFDGPDVATFSALGAQLQVCCGLNQEIIPNVGVPSIPFGTKCPNLQDVLAVPGSVSRGTP